MNGRAYRGSAARRAQWLVLGVVVVALAATGCSSGPTPREKQYRAVYERVLSPAQMERYRSLRTSAEREAFVEALGLGRRLRSLDQKTRQAVLAGEVSPGMKQSEVLLAWGLPFIRIARVEGGLLKDVWTYPRTRDPSGRMVGPRYAYFDDGVLVRTRDETAEPEPFDPVALVLMPFGELVDLLFGVVTLPLAPFSE